jgi:hypothetical protein
MVHFTWNYGEEQIRFDEYFNENEEETKGFLGEDEQNYMLDEYANPSDYLFDIHMTKLMREAVVKYNYDVSERNINLGYEQAQTFLAYNKGLLIELTRTVSQETDDDELREQVFQFIDYWRDVWNGHMQVEDVYEQMSTFYSDDSRFYEEAIAIRNYYEQEHHYPPYYLFEKMVARISRLMVARRRLVRQVKYIYAYLPQNGQALTCQMILNDNYYRNFMERVRERVVVDVETAVNDYLSASSIDDSAFIYSVKHMIDCINSCDNGGNHNFGKYRVKKKGCFSLFDTGTDRYASLSGPFDVTEPSIKSYFSFDKRKQDANDNLIKKINSIILADSHLRGTKYANLTLYTKRFPYCGGPVIPNNGETVQDAMNRRVLSSDIQSDYSCCERKIIPFVPNTFSGLGFMFARHEPCKKCRPALKNFLNQTRCDMRIYYYENDVIKEFNVSNL